MSVKIHAANALRMLYTQGEISAPPSPFLMIESTLIDGGLVFTQFADE